MRLQNVCPLIVLYILFICFISYVEAHIIYMLQSILFSGAVLGGESWFRTLSSDLWHPWEWCFLYWGRPSCQRQLDFFSRLMRINGLEILAVSGRVEGKESERTTTNENVSTVVYNSGNIKWTQHNSWIRVHGALKSRHLTTRHYRQHGQRARDLIV